MLPAALSPSLLLMVISKTRFCFEPALTRSTALPSLSMTLDEWIDPQGSLNVTISGETQVVGHVAATPIVGTTGQTAQEALDANNDKAFTTDVDGLTVSLTSADFDYSDAETDENGNSVTTYTLNESGQDKVKAAVADLGSDYSVTNLDKVSSTITIPEADTPEITDRSAPSLRDSFNTVTEKVFV